MLMSGKILLCLSVLALMGTLAMPPVHEATAQMHWKKKQWAAKKKWGGKKHWGARKNCRLQFEPGGGRGLRKKCN